MLQNEMAETFFSKHSKKCVYELTVIPVLNKYFFIFGMDLSAVATFDFFAISIAVALDVRLSNVSTASWEDNCKITHVKRFIVNKY